MLGDLVIHGWKLQNVSRFRFYFVAHPMPSRIEWASGWHCDDWCTEVAHTSPPPICMCTSSAHTVPGCRDHPDSVPPRLSCGWSKYPGLFDVCLPCRALASSVHSLTRFKSRGFEEEIPFAPSRLPSNPTPSSSFPAVPHRTKSEPAFLQTVITVGESSSEDEEASGRLLVGLAKLVQRVWHADCHLGASWLDG